MSPPCQASSWAFSRDRQHFGVPRHLLGMEWIASDVTLGAELAERAVAGDRAAFARIVATHHADHVACQCATSRDGMSCTIGQATMMEASPSDG